MANRSFKCPSCRQMVDAPVSLRVGESMVCPTCSFQFVTRKNAPLVLTAMAVMTLLIAIGAGSFWILSWKRVDAVARPPQAQTAHRTRKVHAESKLTTKAPPSQPANKPSVPETPKAAAPQSNLEKPKLTAVAIARADTDADTRVLQEPATASSARRPQREEPLQYRWQIGREYGCHFSISASVNDQWIVCTGLRSYRPGGIHPSTRSRDDALLQTQGSGTAFVVHPDGFLVTCAHVVEDASEIRVQIGGNSVPAKPVVVDRQTDVAILRIRAKGLRPLGLGDSDTVELTQEIRAFGYPLLDVLGESIKVTRGEISGAVRHENQNYFQIDATVNPGISGGPIVDSHGRVIGVANAMLAGADIASVGFAIPINDVRALLNKQNIVPSTPSSTSKLDGPAVARLVGPSVVLLKVRIGRAAEVNKYRTITFSGNHTTRIETSNRYQRITADSANMLRGKYVCDQFGTIVGSEGDTALPSVFGQMTHVGFEPLPADGSRTWQTSQMTVVKRSKPSDPSSRYGIDNYFNDFRSRRDASTPYADRYPSRPNSRYTAPLPYSRRVPRSRVDPYGRESPKPAEYETHLAMEEVHYELGKASGDTVEIKKTYHLVTSRKDKQLPYLEIDGTGTITFDRAKGVPRKANLNFTYKVSEKQITMHLPITFTYTMQDPDKYAEEIRAAKARIEAYRKKAAATPQVSNVTTPDTGTNSKPVVRTFDPPADAHRTPTRPERSFGGLDKFDPSN